MRASYLPPARRRRLSSRSNATLARACEILLEGDGNQQRVGMICDKDQPVAWVVARRARGSARSRGGVSIFFFCFSSFGCFELVNGLQTRLLLPPREIAEASGNALPRKPRGIDLERSFLQTRTLRRSIG